MLRTRAIWRRKLDNMLKGKGLPIDKILDMNESLYDREVTDLV